MIVTFVLLLSFVMTGCGGRENTSGTSQTAGGNGNNAELSQALELSSPDIMESSDEAEMAENERILIAYFSYTGNTAEAAQTIAEYTGGNLAEIKRTEEYGDLLPWFGESIADERGRRTD